MTYKPEKGSRQPVVLYDKDNKAIDVSGIEELSSVKIDTGKIAGDLKLVKDNQGRLYGKYGEAWIPVKVDSEGRPIISQGPAGTEPWPVQLSDSEDLAQDLTVQGVKSELEDVNSELEDVNSELALIKSELANIKANQLSGNQKVTLSGTIAILYSMNFADRPLYTEITEPTVFVLMNSAMDMWWTDGSADWVVI
jgi:hypothetical protein